MRGKGTENSLECLVRIDYRLWTIDYGLLDLGLVTLCKHTGHQLSLAQDPPPGCNLLFVYTAISSAPCHWFSSPALRFGVNAIAFSKKTGTV